MAGKYDIGNFARLLLDFGLYKSVEKVVSSIEETSDISEEWDKDLEYLGLLCQGKQDTELESFAIAVPKRSLSFVRWPSVRTQSQCGR